MISFDRTQVFGFRAAIRGMRNPKNSWEISDTFFVPFEHCTTPEEQKNALLCDGVAPVIGQKDMKLMKSLRSAGSDHRKYLRFITVYVDITAPLYWWKEFDTYKVGTVENSCSTMHKIHAKEFTLGDFSFEHCKDDPLMMDTMETIIVALNKSRECFLQTKDKKFWWNMIQLLPTSYNQKRTVMLNYEVLNNMCRIGRRRDHKLDEWRIDFMDWAKSLPYADELIFD